MPDIIIVKKAYPKYRKKNKKRNWKLKHLDPEKEEGTPEDQVIAVTEKVVDGDKKKKQKKEKKKANRVAAIDKRALANHDKDYEMFL